jgi:hypothetical protein
MSNKCRAVCGTWALVVTTIATTPGVAQQFSEWSAPINLGAVNSTGGDFFPFVSRNGLSLYFTSQTCVPTPFPGCRPGFGGWDIFVSQRATVDDPWGPAQNLGPTINTSSNEGAPALSPDGHVMFFASTRPGGFGGNDIYVSRRHNKRDDFGWQPPENLGGNVNTSANEASPELFEDDATGVITLYFESNRVDGPGPYTNDPSSNGNDIYASLLQPDDMFGVATLVAELSTPYADRQPTVRRDGLEIVFASNRPGPDAVGGLDLWVSTRAATSDPWPPPVDLGPLVNYAGNDAGPAFSFDGRTLYFQSDRPGGYGQYDLHAITRTKAWE